MSITINGATNTLTAASGLTIAGNTAVTGTLSASGTTYARGYTVSPLSGEGVEIDYGAAGASIGRVLAYDRSAAAAKALQLAGLTVDVKAGAGLSTVGAFSTSGLAVTGTLSASGVTSVTDTTDATSTTAASLKTAGGLGVAKKAYFGDNIVMASGKGIDFSATSNGSGTTTSEVLSDYEEGTWTPTLIGQTTAGTQTYTQQVGIYTKIGNLVTVHGSVTITAKDGAMAGNVIVGGLPFTANNTTVPLMAGVVVGQTGITYPASQTQISCIAVGNTTYMRLIVDKSNGGGGAYIDTADIAATTAFGFSCTYRVA